MDGFIALTLFSGVWFVLVKYYKKNGHPAWKRHLAGSAAATLATLIFIVIITPETSQAEMQSQSVAIDGETVVPDLGLHPEEYASRFNALMKELDRPHRLTIRITEGPAKNSFHSNLSERLSVIGSVDKSTGQLLEVLFIGSGNNTMESGLDVFVTGAVTLTAAVRGATLKEVTSQVLTLSKQFDNDEKKESVNQIYRDVKFFHIRNEMLGTWYGASAV